MNKGLCAGDVSQWCSFAENMSVFAIGYMCPVPDLCFGGKRGSVISTHAYITYLLYEYSGITHVGVARSDCLHWADREMQGKTGIVSLRKKKKMTVGRGISALAILAIRYK